MAMSSTSACRVTTTVFAAIRLRRSAMSASSDFARFDAGPLPVGCGFVTRGVFAADAVAGVACADGNATPAAISSARTGPRRRGRPLAAPGGRQDGNIGRGEQETAGRLGWYDVRKVWRRRIQ